jgi:hypothetical protein
VRLTFEGELWLWEGKASWHFVTVPVDDADELRDEAARAPKGFGSVKVLATIGATRWSTSVFPDKASDSYVLPVKALVRKANQVEAGDVVSVTLETWHAVTPS